MSQDDNELILDNNSMCDMVKDAFEYHQHSMMDDRNIGVESGHTINNGLKYNVIFH